MIPWFRRFGVYIIAIAAVTVAGVVALWKNNHLDMIEPLSLIVILLLCAVGTGLLLIVVYDADRRFVAKATLRRWVNELEPDDLQMMETIVTDGQPLRVFLYYPPFERPFLRSGRFSSVIEWLSTGRLGVLASDALFQRSRAGRLRYFRDVKASRRGGRQQTYQ
jgi:hypothetical protein